MTAAVDEAFVRHYTVLMPTALTPGVRLYLATEFTPLWLATEDFLQKHNVAPPYWAFVWPGSEAIAWHVTANPGLVAGLRVLDFAAGSGLAGIVCAQAGAAVDAAEIDPLAGVAIRLNAAENNCKINVLIDDIVGTPCQWDVIFAGDVCYEAPMAARILPWLRDCAATATVIIADPGRAYVPRAGVSVLASITVPTSRMLEDGDTRVVTLLELHQ